MTIVRINNFQAAENKEQDLFEFLQSLLPYITNSEGCLACELYRNEDATDAFVIIEKWQSKAFHQQSIAGFPQDKMLTAMSLFAAPPQGTYLVEKND